MDGSGQGGSNSPPPFLTKTYDMIDDPASNPIVSWSHTDNSFIIWDPTTFARDLLPKYFKHNNFSSFVRQLNTYGFRKIDPDQWEFANEEFIRGQKHLLKNIRRRKPIHSHSLHHHGEGPSGESERHDLEEEIERLKHDKGMLLVELQKHTHQQHGLERQMQSLEERLLNVELGQRTMIANVSQIVKTPGFLTSIVATPSDLYTRKRRLPNGDLFSEGATLQATTGGEKPEGAPLPGLNMEAVEKMESSLHSLENFFREVSEASGGGDMYYDVPSGVVITELHEEEEDVRIRSPSPLSSQCVRGIGSSSPDLAESTNYAESPAIPLSEICAETMETTPSKVSEIDVNSAPAAPKDHKPRNNRATAAAGVNDVFWEQFLTETPGATDTQEAQSERRAENNNRKGEARGGWWNRKNVDHRLSDQMASLTPAEKT